MMVCLSFTAGLQMRAQTAGDPRLGRPANQAVGAADLSVTMSDTPDPVLVGTDLAYAINIVNGGPLTATNASWTDTLPATTTFVSLQAPAGWVCTSPAIGATGTVSCSNPSFPISSAGFTLTVHVAPGLAPGTVLSNTATVSSSTADQNPTNNSGTATTTVGSSADLQLTKVDTPDPVTAGQNLTYTITATNAGPTNAASAVLTDPLPAGTTFNSLVAAAGWTCTTPAIGANGTVSCTNSSFAPGTASFTIVVGVPSSAATGTTYTNVATISSASTDPNSANNSGTATTSVLSAGAVPTLSELGLAALAIVLAMTAMLAMRP